MLNLPMAQNSLWKWNTPLSGGLRYLSSLNDQVTIQKVLINGGKSKCRVMLRSDLMGSVGGTYFPLKLNYTESWRLVMTEPCRLREVTLFTNLGNASYTIE
ncbi:hypothetical protein [Aeromonas allosaccharophila]|uniref:hypothetical protein n=1 Tax=Aeromonas allosaccharophila TaxID=656 RepID=UPI003985BA7C